jgi:putative flippase GtrA
MTEKKLRDIKKFSKYSFVGVTSFLIDLALLWMLVELFNKHYLSSAITAFLIAISINYSANRYLTYKGTKTSFSRGYLYFLSFALLGVLIISSLMYLSVDVLEFNYLLSRTFIAGFVGILNYSLNTMFTFNF